MKNLRRALVFVVTSIASTTTVFGTGCTVSDNNLDIRCGVGVVVGDPITGTPTVDAGGPRIAQMIPYRCDILYWTTPEGGDLNEHQEFVSAESPELAAVKAEKVWRRKWDSIIKKLGWKLFGIVCTEEGTPLNQCGGDNQGGVTSTGSGPDGGDLKPQGGWYYLVTKEEFEAPTLPSDLDQHLLLWIKH